MGSAIGQPQAFQRGFVDPGTIFKSVERLKIDGQIAGAVSSVIETAFWNAADEGHLATFKPDADGTAGTGGLAFATAAAGLAVATGLSLAEAFATVFSTRSGFQVM